MFSETVKFKPVIKEIEKQCYNSNLQMSQGNGLGCASLEIGDDLHSNARLRPRPSASVETVVRPIKQRLEQQTTWTRSRKN